MENAHHTLKAIKLKAKIGGWVLVVGEGGDFGNCTYGNLSSSKAKYISILLFL